MTVEVRYLVIREGKEVGMYTSKKEADAHDKMLDIAENLFSFIEKAEGLGMNENQIEELSIYLSNHRETVIQILKGTSPQDVGSRAVQEEADTVPLSEQRNPPKGRKRKQIETP
jgi:uncharacterized protein